MKNKSLIIASFACLTLAGCNMAGGNSGSSLLSGNTLSTISSGTSVIGSLLSTAASGNNLGNILTSIIGLDKVNASNLVGTWRYKQPGCAFTTEQALYNAGGEVVAASVKEKLATAYNKVGIKSANTGFVFKNDGTFSATLLGKTISGTYTFNESTQAINLNCTLISLTGYVKKNTDGIAVLFESKKILTLIQALGSVSGNSTLSTVSSLSTNYDGVRVGFDLVK